MAVTKTAGLAVDALRELVTSGEAVASTLVRFGANRSMFAAAPML